jgi:hypothetical protein
MIPTKNLPPNFRVHREINLQKDRDLLIRLNLWGLTLFPLIGFLLIFLGRAFHPEIHSLFAILKPDIPIITLIIYIIFGLFLVTILHELIHGIFFWITTWQFPIFGFKGPYAFAAAPEWYIPFKPYFLIGIAPLAIISVVGVICIPFIPSKYLLPWLLCILANTCGAVGDVYILLVINHQPATILVKDQGDVITVYRVSEN